MKTSILLSLFLVACGGPTFESVDSTETDSGSDSNPPATDAQNGLTPDSRLVDGAGGFEADAGWPDDVVLVPYCPDAEIFPANSPTCYTWGAEHGWTIPGCCLSDHTCGTFWNNRCNR